MKKFPMFHVDAFTDTLFQGNPAAVVLLQHEWLPEWQMQKIAFENNLSETAFVKQLEEKGHYMIRWFTPVNEVPLCGHATLASSFVLLNANQNLTRITFDTLQVGRLTVEKGNNGRLAMNFPNRQPTEVIEQAPEALLKGLSIAPQKLLRSIQAYFVIYDDEQKVKEVTYLPEQLIKLAPISVVVTAQGDSPEYDIISRYIATNHGVVEDPVTGSIHAGLAPYWANQLGKNKLVAYQASVRGGTLYCEVKGDRIIIEGHAVLFSNGFVYV